MPSPSNDLLHGTLDLLVLRVLRQGEMHGWGVSLRIQEISRDALKVNQGSLYPALHRLEERGWISADWGVSDNGRRARFYRLTAKGKRELENERITWEQYAAAVRLVLDLA